MKYWYHKIFSGNEKDGPKEKKEISKLLIPNSFNLYIDDKPRKGDGKFYLESDTLIDSKIQSHGYEMCANMDLVKNDLEVVR